MSTRKKEIWMLIQRYVTGSVTSEEKSKLEKWMGQSPENKQLVLEVKNIWEKTPAESFDVNVEEAWKRFKRLNIRKKRPAYQIAKPPKTTLYLYRIAAVILVSLFAGYVLYTQNQFENNRLQQEKIVTMQEITTGVGDKAQVTFSDGSSVTINASTKIEFPKKFKSEKREVYLDGEAYFEVQHDPDRPFIVYNRDIEVEVLGTEFNIRGWKEDDSMDVTVRTGKVSVKPIDKTTENSFNTILTDNTFTRVVDGFPPSPIQKVVVKERLVWMSGGMYFDNTPFHRVISDIERRFAVDIEVADSAITDVPFTSTFYKADLEEVLSVISASMELDYERFEGRNIKFFKTEDS